MPQRLKPKKRKTRYNPRELYNYQVRKQAQEHAVKRGWSEAHELFKF